MVLIAQVSHSPVTRPDLTDQPAERASARQDVAVEALWKYFEDNNEIFAALVAALRAVP
ncbi:hypothetical protein [Streptomyces sp. NRRL S-1824]|uniref:hypothetical protein n=1 Tax=Streptomyces sp. NRRL S-1824 TaxID=1463889 RepID=UPI000AE970BF|nr:hypothetical protein [Streptomyces sp. NRRL S-1824]